MTIHHQRSNAAKTIIEDRSLEQPTETSSKVKLQIDADLLLPALVEFNIRQARACGQIDLVEELQRLQIILQARNTIHHDQEEPNHKAE